MTRTSARRFGERPDLSVPGGGPIMSPHYDPDAFGRFSEAIARFMGTGRFLVAQTVLVVGWIVLNTVGIVKHWDPYPFILLNLAFSTQAAYAAPLILLAQNRQDDRDRANIDRDRAVRLALADVVTTEDLDDSLTRMARLITDAGPPPGPPSPEARRPESLAAPRPMIRPDSLTSPGNQPSANHAQPGPDHG
jgi:low affinity Fe/Cu permease